MGVWSASRIASLNREVESFLQRSGPVLYLSNRSLFDAILSLGQSLISGLPHPSAAGEHPTSPYSGWFRLLSPANDKAHVKRFNGESNPNPQNSLKSKTTSMHWAMRHRFKHMDRHNYYCLSLTRLTMYVVYISQNRKKAELFDGKCLPCTLTVTGLIQVGTNIYDKNIKIFI